MKVGLKALRVNAGLSQAEAMEKLGIKTKQILCDIENGNRDISISLLDKMCLVYGCTLNDILLPKFSQKVRETQE